MKGVFSWLVFFFFVSCLKTEVICLTTGRIPSVPSTCIIMICLKPEKIIIDSHNAKINTYAIQLDLRYSCASLQPKEAWTRFCIELSSNTLFLSIYLNYLYSFPGNKFRAGSAVIDKDI